MRDDGGRKACGVGGLRLEAKKMKANGIAQSSRLKAQRERPKRS
jgi:hypothetical protein